MSDVHIPIPSTIVLGPTDADEDIWSLRYRCNQCGEVIRTMLPRQQREEMNAEFTGVDL